MKYREHRSPCEMSVEVTSDDGQRHAGVIINVSPWGARVARLDGYRTGERLRLRVGNGVQMIDANVRWSGRGLTGVRFAQPLDMRTVAVLRNATGHRSTAKATGWNLQFRELR